MNGDMGEMSIRCRYEMMQPLDKISLKGVNVNMGSSGSRVEIGQARLWRQHGELFVPSKQDYRTGRQRLLNVL